MSRCWYEERWFDEDLMNALENAGIESTEENMAMLKKECLHIFDDKSERNEILVNVAHELFGGCLSKGRSKAQLS